MTTPSPAQAAFESWLRTRSPDDPAQAGAAAHWAEYQRLLAVEARLKARVETLRRNAEWEAYREWCAGQDERRAG